MSVGKEVILFVSCAFFICNVRCQNSKLVNTSQGPVRGYEGFEGVFAFYGIPYATAPTGIHKYQAPLPAPTWSEPLEAVDQEIACPQIPNKLLKPYRIEQQCLVVNVFVPDTDEINLPVVVFIHGGAFMMNFGNIRTPSHVVRTEKVIVVTFNYRLGLHGFLCLGTEGAPGNAGLKDQLAALKWVNKNIAAFGGNPNEVILDGYSAGTACVDILSLSPAAVGLFNKVIIGSVASSNSPLVVVDPLESAKEFASKLGFNDTENIFTLEKFYTESPLDNLINLNDSKYLEEMEDGNFYFSPCVENNAEEIKIITESPLEILQKGKYIKLPMLFAFANMEGLINREKFDAWKVKMNENFSQFLPGNLLFDDIEEKKFIAETVRQFYFGDTPVQNDKILKYVDFFSDSVFFSTILRSLSLHLKAGHENIYLFEYEFVSTDSEVIPYTNIRGAGHCAETYAVLDGTETEVQANETGLSDDLKKMKVISRSVWANFVKTGSPVVPGCELPPWPPVGPGLSPHMVLTLQPRLEHQWDQQFLRRIRLWDNLYQLYGATPIPPSASTN